MPSANTPNANGDYWAMKVYVRLPDGTITENVMQVMDLILQVCPFLHIINPGSGSPEIRSRIGHAEKTAQKRDDVEQSHDPQKSKIVDCRGAEYILL